MHVVVVDPSRTVLKAVSRLLESDGHVVSAFTGGQDALDFIKATADVHALITSAELGPMTGSSYAGKPDCSVTTIGRSTSF
jgi:two-component system cell cycle response regulator